MNILLLVPDLRRKGGVANYYKRLKLNELSNITYFQINTVDTPAEENTNIFDFLLLIKKFSNLPLLYLKYIFTVFRYQLIHVNPSLNPKSFYRDMIFIFIAKIFNKSVLVFFRGWDDDFEEKIKNSTLLTFLFKMTFAKADGFLVLGQLFKDKLIELGVAPSKSFYIETTIADSRYIEYLDLDEKIKSYSNNSNFLFISRILKRKGIFIAIDAFAKSNKKLKNRKLTFYIAGDGEDLQKAKDYVRQKGYPDIVFLGYTMNEDKKFVLLNCHIMIFPTYYGEGLPNSILEAMLYGMPVISRLNAGIPDVVEHEVNGFLTDSLDSNVFSDYCTRLLEDKNTLLLILIWVG